jgi:hypothetical protein
MINNNRRVIVTFNVIYTIALSLLTALIFRKNLGDLSSWVFIIPKVITVQAASILLFNSYLWKLRIFKKWLVAFPDLSGTWLGTLKSDYVNPNTKNRVNPIPCMLVIKHRYKNIRIRLQTAESISYSFSEEIEFDNEKHQKRISYSYTNEPNTLLDYRSNSHRGTVVLGLINDNELIGHYYTDRKTKGEMSFKFHTKSLLDQLPEGLPEHPMSNR